MSSESAFPRPTSLYQPERYTPSLVDSSSYSPFPTIAGSRADPFGLNAYLLHPEDQLWAYIAPAPSEEPYSPPRDKDRAGKDGSDLGKPRPGLKKIESNAALRKGSPLAQSSVVPNNLDVPEQRKLVRRRSKSLDSTSSKNSAIALDQRPPPMPLPVPVQQKNASVGRKGFGRLFGRRKSIPNIAAIVDEDLPPVPAIPISKTAASSSSDLSTPSSNRSSLNLSDMTTASSSSSSVDILRTPTGSPPLPSADFMVPAAKVEIDDGSLRKKGLRGWLGKKGSKAALTSTDPKATSPSISPNSSATNLTATPASGLQPADPPSRILPTPEQEPYAWVGDQLRRASYRKLSQLRRPSAHPLAQQLRRQTSHLPNEVASSFEIGQIIYPRSVNYRDPSGGLIPAQRGLWCLLHVKLVLDQLDRGCLPAGPMGKRPSLPHMTSDKRARGMQDFVSRPPFEERHYVYFPNDVWSPVSIARPGFGVWDLDFSKYILALAESGEEENPGWPNIPRPSFLGVDELRNAMEGAEMSVSPVTSSEDLSGEASTPVTEDCHKATSITSMSSEDSVSTIASMVIATPPVLDSEHSIPEIKIDSDDSDAPSGEGSLEVARPYQAHSSFRRSRVIQQTWDDSDDEDAVDDRVSEPERSIPKSESQTLPDLSAIPASAELGPRLPHERHSRRISQPVVSEHQRTAASKLISRRSQFELAGDSADNHQRAMDEVANARERRRALHSGEVDRQAEGEQRRAEEAKRRAASSGPSGSRNRLSTLSTGTGLDTRQRIKSFASDSSASPHIGSPRSSSLGPTERFHSFYELPSSSAGTVTPTNKGASLPSPVQYSAHLPSHQSRPGMVSSTSMSFPPQAMAGGMHYYPHGFPQPMQPMYYPTPAPSYGYHHSPQMAPLGMPAAPFRHGLSASKSALSLPDQKPAPRRWGPYA